MLSTTVITILASVGIALIAIVIAVLFSRKKPAPQQVRKDSADEDSKESHKKGKKKGQSSKGEKEPVEKPATSEEHHPTLKELKKHSAKTAHPKRTHKHVHPEHQRYVSGFKGFHELMTDVDITETYIAISSKDGTVKVFELSTITDENPHYYLAHVEGNFATALSLSPDQSKLAIGLSNDKTLELLDFNKNAEKKDMFIRNNKFKSGAHKDEIIKVKCFNEFIISVGGDRDTNIKIWDFEGNCLHTHNTNLDHHYFVNFGVSSKFIFLGTWSPDGRAYEIQTEKVDRKAEKKSDKKADLAHAHPKFKGLQKIMTFGGHRKGIKTFGVNNLETLAVTLSEDQSIKVWDIHVKYEFHQDPKCLKTIEANNKEIFPNNEISAVALYTEEASGKTLIAFGGGNNIVIASLDQLKIIERIDGAHSDECKIGELKFLNVGKHVYLLSHGVEDIRINIFKIK